MTDKELKRLNRRELLEMLIMQSKKIDRMQTEIDELNQKLSKRDLVISESGSIAEASIKINNVFANAQTAADQYLKNVYNLHADTEKECRILREKTEAECREMEKQAKEQAQQYLEQTKQMIDSGVSDFKERMKEMADMLFDQEKVNEILNGDKHEKE